MQACHYRSLGGMRPQGLASLHHRKIEKVIAGRRRTGTPFQRVRIPGIAPRDLAMTTAPENIAKKDQHTTRENHAPCSGQQVEGAPSHVWKIRVNPAWHTLQPELVHGEEGQIET